jgi:hypothetical protein
MTDLPGELVELKPSPTCVLGLLDPCEFGLQVVNACAGVDALVFELAEAHDFGHGVPVSVALNPLADMCISCAGSGKEVQNPWVEGKDSCVVVVVIGAMVVSCIQLSHVGGIGGVVLLWIACGVTVGELFDPICGLEVAILDGDDEVRSLAVVVSNVSFRYLLGELVGQIPFCLSFQVSDSFCGSGALGLVVSFSSPDSLDEPLGDLHDGFWVVDVELEGSGGSMGRDGSGGINPGGGRGLVGGVDRDIGHSLVVEGARVVLAEEGVLADVALREFIAEQEVEAVKALLWSEVELGEFDLAGDG